jgi:hypothetical protein
MPKLVAILKTGTYTDSAGKEHTFTEADLDTMVAKYNPAEHEAPEVIGHPKTNAPAWGWVKGLKREGELLFYEPDKRVSEFQEMINRGMFKKRSASFYPDLTLRHVGWLGAQPPAVKGLPDPATFADDKESITIEFSEAFALNIVGYTFQRLREWIITKFGQDEADKVIDNYDIDQLKNVTPVEEAPALANSFTEKGAAADIPVAKTEQGGDDMAEKDELEKKLKEKETEAAEFAEREKADKQKIRDLEAANRKAEYAAFCEGLSKEGKLTPAMQPAALDFMEILSGVVPFEFTELDDKGAEKKVKDHPLDRFKALLTGLPKQVEFSEVATKKKATDTAQGTAGEKLDAFAHEKIKANQTLTYSAAFAEVQKEHIDLATEYADEIRGGK